MLHFIQMSPLSMRLVWGSSQQGAALQLAYDLFSCKKKGERCSPPWPCPPHEACCFPNTQGEGGDSAGLTERGEASSRLAAILQQMR